MQFLSNLPQLSNCIRFLSMDMVEKANSGHPGMPMGMADVATVLFQRYIKFNPKDPKWSNRDRFILSGGHGSALLYSILYLTGYDQPTIDDLKNFRKLESPCAGHPEYGHLEGVETTTGPLGQGLANAVGMAIAQKKDFNRSNGKLDYKVYVFVGDGDLMEGLSHEALSLAGHLNLNNLVVLFDDNQITIDGPTHLSTSEDVLKRFESYGFETLSIDGHDFKAIDQALNHAQKTSKPIVISCRTVIAKGAPTKAGTCGAHGSPLGLSEIEATRKALNWDFDPFYIPEDLLAEWRKFYKRNIENYESTKNIRLDNAIVISKDVKNEFKKSLHEARATKATRQLFQDVLNFFEPYIPNMIGGSADLTPSNNTKTKNQKVISKESFEGSYIHYGIREHGMASIMNGLSLSGYLPYGGTFLVFSDYMRPSIRLSALMKQHVFYIMTHDSIGLGEDGPTHQPIEHLSSLRMIPNVKVFRPCDAAEMFECFELALENNNGPSVFALSRQNIPYLRKEYSDMNMSRKGAYVLRTEDTSKQLDITLVATGSEVNFCIEAKEQLRIKNMNIRIVSIPCFELFNHLTLEEKQIILGQPKLTIAIEAASLQGFESLFYKASVGKSVVLGMKSFGASAPADVLFNHFELTTQKIVELAMGS
jgi:transketolase